jgi:aminopeptidase N
MKIKAIVIIALLISKAMAQNAVPTTEGEPYNRTLDFKELMLDISFNEKMGQVIGNVTHIFSPLAPNVDSVFLHGIQMKVKTISLNNNTVNYKVTDAGIMIYFSKPIKWNQQDTLNISYSCTPQKGIYFIGWNDATNRCRKQIWTQGEGEDNRHWIPMYDGLNDKTITSIKVKFDSQYKVLSNGILKSKKEKDGFTEWQYSMTHPHSTYLIMLGIGLYDIEKRKSKKGTPVSLYYYPNQSYKVPYTYQYATECIDFLEDQTGINYPWESYAQIPVQDFMYGAMENTTATIFGDFFLNDYRSSLDKSYNNVDVHELTHQWFGDYITGRSWKHMWLQESFATYYPKIFNKKINGQQAYEWNKRNEHVAALDASEKNNFPVVSNQAGSARHYQKGSAVLDMMNYIWGEESYKRMIHYYLKKHAYQNVETNDLYQAFQDTLGLAPDWFFNQWLYKGGEPHYLVSTQEIFVQENKHTQFTVKQIQKTNAEVGLFKMPIVMEVHYGDGTYDSIKQWITDELTIVNIPNKQNKNILFCLFDPANNVLKKCTFEKQPIDFINQFQYAKSFIDRYDAAVELRRVAIAHKRNELVNQYYKETFYAIKVEIVNQLLGDESAGAQLIIQQALLDASPEVRRAPLSNINAITPSLLPVFEALLNDSSYVTAELALKKLTEKYPNNTPKYLSLTDHQYGNGNSFRSKWLEISIANQPNNDTLINELIDYSSESYEFITRKNAAESLKRLNICNDEFAKNILQAMCSSNGRLAGPFTTVFNYLYENNLYKPIFKKALTGNNWTTIQLETLRKNVK